MAKNVKSSAVKNCIELASLGAFEEARKRMGKDCTEDMFYANISSSRYNSNLFNFVQEFKNPDWHAYVQSMNAKSAPDFFHLAKKNNIDLLSKNKDGETIIDIIMGNVSSYERAVFTEAIDSDIIVKLFLSPKASENIFNWIKDEIRYANQGKPTSSLLDKLNTPEVLTSENRKKFIEDESFFKRIIDELAIAKLSDFFNKYPDFFGEYIKEALDTKLIKKLHHPNSIDADVEKAFKPNLNLLDDGWKNAVENGNFNMEIDSKEYLTFKKLLANGLLETEKYNNPNERYYTVFERFLVDNISNTRFSSEDTPKVLKIIEEAEELSKFGIEKKCVVKSSKDMNDILENSFKRHKRFSVDADIDELAWKLHLPPPLLQDLVDFFDKRYNYSPENKNGVDPEKENMQQAWNGLMSQITFTKEVEQEKKVTMKP